MAAKKKSGSRKSVAKKASKKRKPRAAAKKSAAKTRKPKAAKKKAAKQALVSPAIAQLDERIAVLRNNLRDLTEQATAYSGASTEELMSDRIAQQEAKLALLIAQREKLARRGS
ncbi:MAG TPA: hypothetical protein VE087_12340 [Xanthobacteraceae bacterium]|nr:hypothetical protein [Xanthobacteraceae bacterium]